MAPNLPPSITVNRNLASTLRNYIKANGGKNVSEAELNNILQKVAKFDAERDAGTREGGSIFDGGSKYLGGTGKDFQVRQGQQIQLSAEEFNEIFAGFLDPVAAQNTQEVTLPNPNEAAPTAPSQSDSASLAELAQTTDMPEEISPAPEQETEVLLDSVDGKIIEREVNGKKQKISVATVDGQKVRRAVNEDGSLGDTLVPISTAGKNKYITQTEMDNRMRAALGLAENEEIPKDIKGEFVTIGGEPTLIFKKDGKTMDQAQLSEYVSNLKNDGEIHEPQIEKKVTDQPPMDNMAQAMERPWQEFTAQPGIPAPVTGPPEGENPEYDAAVRGRNVDPVKEEPVTLPQEDVNPQVEPTKNKVSGNGVSGTYCITENKSGNGFDLQMDMSVSVMENDDIRDLFFSNRLDNDNPNRNLGVDKDGNYTFRGIKARNFQTLDRYITNMAQNVAMRQAIYNDLMTKKNSGTELTSAEQNFVQDYLKVLDKLGISQRADGTLVDKSE